MVVDLTRWTAAVSGLIATGAAALVLVMLPTDPPGPSDQATASAVAIDPSSIHVATVVARTPPEPMAGIDQTVSSALTASGYTEFVGTADLESLLPRSVVSALEEAEAVLVIPDLGDQ